MRACFFQKFSVHAYNDGRGRKQRRKKANFGKVSEGAVFTVLKNKTKQQKYPPKNPKQQTPKQQQKPNTEKAKG